MTRPQFPFKDKAYSATNAIEALLLKSLEHQIFVSTDHKQRMAAAITMIAFVSMEYRVVFYSGFLFNTFVNLK